MWFFSSPNLIFGEDALCWLESFTGEKAFIVTDANMLRLGFVQRVQDHLSKAGIASQAFSEVEPDPSIETARRAAAVMSEYAPDWVIGLGGGSSLDAAKAAWFIYERPDVDLEAINPMQQFGLRAKARFITIPTTSGSGAEVTAAAVIKDTQAHRKLEMASRELIADFSLIDPCLSCEMPAGLTAETGIDALTHAIEGYISVWNNDFSDALCLHATRLIFEYLPRAVSHGIHDLEARERMANAATMAGLGMGNSHIALAHAMGHSMGVLFGLPHGRSAGMALPTTLEFNANAGLGRSKGLAELLRLPAADEKQAGFALAGAVRKLMSQIDLPTNLASAGVEREFFAANLEQLCQNAQMDVALATSCRIPSYEELNQLFWAVYDGKTIDF
jgi:alcohol dehydrogenase class IV